MKLKKIFLIFLLAIFLIFLLSDFCFAQKRLEIEYPALPGVETPMTTKTTLPNYLRYIFTLAIIIAGILAFIAMVMGGIKYLTSVGSPAAMSDARDQITSGILGLIILLASFLILNTINPQLILPKMPPITPAVAGIRVYAMPGCDFTTPEGQKKCCAEDASYPSFKVIQNIPKLSEIKSLVDTTEKKWGTGQELFIESIKFLSQPGDLTVNIHPLNDYDGSPQVYDYLPTDNPACTTTPPGPKCSACQDFSSAIDHRSIKLDWHIPGVYLYSNSTDCGVSSTTGNLKDVEVKIYQASSATLPGFNDKTKSIKFVYDNPDSAKAKTKYVAILHEDENFMGKAMLYDQDQGDTNCKNLSENLYEPPGGGAHDAPYSIGVSSITVYLKPITSPPYSGGVKFADHKNYSGCVLPATGVYGDNDKDTNLADGPNLCGGYHKVDDEDVCDKDGHCNDQVSSVEINGNYVALLFRDANYDGDCEVFMSSDPNLRDNRSGQCGFWGRGDCLTSFIIKARK